MLRVRRFASLAFSIAVLASCSQLVGLDNLDPDEDEGDGGTGLSSSSGGEGGDDGGSNSSGGKGGSNSSGGKGGSGGSSGSSGGRGGQPSEGGEGGDDSRGGSISDGGTKVTSGGTAGVSGAGGTTTVPEFNIPEDCSSIIEITSLSLDDVGLDSGSVDYIYLMSPGFGTASEDFLDFEIYADGTYNGETTGTFEIDGGLDASFATCSRCLMGWEDDVDANFFAMGGTITVAADSEHMDGTPNITLTDVTLVESTILDDAPYTTTPLENARCLHIQSAVLTEGVTPLPPVWNCSEAYWNDDYCDCGCGSHDVDCETNEISECFNDTCNCETGYVCSTVDNGLCVAEP